MIEMVKIDKKVEDSLEVFIDLLGYKNIYEFPEKSIDIDSHVKSEPKLPEFSERNFTKFVKWFNAFEFYVRWRSLTKEGACMYIGMELSPLKKDLIEKINKETNITTLLQIEILLVRALFNPKILNKTILRVSTDPYLQKDVDEIVGEFIQRCRELFIASLSFLKPNYFVNSFLVLRLLNLLPTKLRVKIEERITDFDHVHINKVIDMILKEKDDLYLDLEYSKPCSLLDKKERKQEQMNSEVNENHVNYICYCCGEKGHVKTNCRYKKGRCNRCKKTGHLSKVCKYDSSKEQKEQPSSISECTKKNNKGKNDKENSSHQRKLQETLELIQKRLTQLEKQKGKVNEKCPRKKDKKLTKGAHRRYSEDSFNESQFTSEEEDDDTE